MEENSYQLEKEMNYQKLVDEFKGRINFPMCAKLLNEYIEEIYKVLKSIKEKYTETIFSSFLVIRVVNFDRYRIIIKESRSRGVHYEKRNEELNEERTIFLSTKHFTSDANKDIAEEIRATGQFKEAIAYGLRCYFNDIKG
jgi:hypothetical protein